MGEREKIFPLILCLSGTTSIQHLCKSRAAVPRSRGPRLTQSRFVANLKPGWRTLSLICALLRKFIQLWPFEPRARGTCLCNRKIWAFIFCFFFLNAALQVLWKDGGRQNPALFYSCRATPSSPHDRLLFKDTKKHFHEIIKRSGSSLASALAC